MSHKIFRSFFVLVLAIGALTISGTQPVRAAGPWYVSTTGSDSNDCLSPGTTCGTINGAIGKATSGDTINVAIGTYTSTGSEVVLIDRDVTLSGGWDDTFSNQRGFTTIDAQQARRGMVQLAVTASIDHFIIKNGFWTNYYGGGIYSEGNLTIVNSSIHDNSIGNLCYGGGIFTSGIILTIENSTVSSNIAGCNGSGIFTSGLANFLIINNSTISGNTRGGIFINGTANLKNTIISGNVGEDCTGTTFTSEGNNIIGNTTNCQITASTGDQFNVNPQLGPFLADRGYFPLQSSSPAINAGNPASCLPTDQRGLVRDTACDIGAFEYTTPGAAESLLAAGGNNQQTGTGTAFPAPLQVAALDNQGNLVSGVTVEFTAPGSGPSGTFADTSTNTTSVTTDANGIATTSIFSANEQEGVYNITASATGLGSVNFSMGQILRPLNDNFAGAEVITSLPFNATVDNTNATTELGEPQGCSFGYRSIWYVFTPSESVAIQVGMAGSMIGGITDIYLASGPGITDLTSVRCASTYNPINFNFEAGKTYYLRVDSNEMGSLQVNLQPITPVSNDNFADAEIVNALPFNAIVDNTNASIEFGEPQGCASAYRTVWYAFTPSENMTLRADMAGGVVWGNMSILLASGPGISDLTTVTCASSGSSPNFHVEAGKTYYLQVDSSYGQAGSLQVNLQQITPPSNDNFANAEVISSLPFNVTIDNTNATAEPNELMLGCSFPFRNVWYTFTPSENMAVQVDMVGSAVGGTVNILLASGPGIVDLTSVACASTSNSSNFSFEAGKTYYLQVDSFGQAGSLQINLKQITPPVNDNFANAESIGSLPFNVTVDNTNATFEPSEPQNCGSRFRSVWYTFTPSENMTVRADTLGSGVWASVDIYVASGPGISDLTFVKCTSSGGSSAGFQVEVGKTYYLRVDSSGQAGSLQLNLAQAIPPANDNFASPETISALPFNKTVNITDASLETNEPQNCYGVNKTVWYSFTFTETTNVRMDTQGSSIGAGLNLYQPHGSGISDQNFLGCTVYTGSISFLAEAGQTYYIQAGNIYGQDGSIQINLNQIIPPTNDNFTNAQGISALPFNATTANIIDASTESGEPQSCYFMSKTIWYVFTPTETIKVLADTQGSTLSGNLNIYRAGTGISDMQFMQCATPGSVATFLAEAGQTYYIQAGPAYGENGTIKINLVEMATISGRVIDAVTGASLPGNVYPYALVMLQKYCGADCFQNISSQYADSEGRFLFDSYYYGSTLSEGTYRIEASASLYQTKQSGLFEFTGTKLNLGDIPLNPPSIILGRAVDANTSNPLTGSVTLFRCNNGDCSEYVNYQYINDNGQFQFIAFYNGTALSGGTYELEFVVPLYNTQRVQVVINDSEYRDLGDVLITPLPHIGSIRGRLIDNATGKPVSSTFTPALNLYRCTNGGCDFVNSQVPDSLGRFNFNTDYSGNALIVGTYQIFAYADQYQEGQTVQFTVGEGDNPNLGNIRLTSFPVRFSEVQACAEIPASGGDCVYSVKITNGLKTKLEGTAWSLANGSLPDSFAGYTEFQARDGQEISLASGKSKVLQFRFLAPANNSSYGSFVCTRIFVGQGSNSVFNTVGFRDLFCVVRNAAGYTVASPQAAMALTQESVTVAAMATDTEPNNSCQTAQEIGAVSQTFMLDGNLDSSQTPDVDFFRFTGTPGLQATIDLEGQSTGKGTLSDPYLGFFDSNCNVVALNDDSGGSLNSRLEITIPADGVFVLGATNCCDSGFYGGGSGTYQLTITPVQYIGSISGRATDAFTKKPLRGDMAPFAYVRLLRCDTFGCVDVAGQNTGSDGRYRFETDSNGALLRTGNYLVVVSANQYHPSETDQFTVSEGENASTGDLALTSYPVRFSDTQACVVPSTGGTCEFSVKITNGLSTRLTGKAWSIIAGYGTGSFTNFTVFQDDPARDVRLDPGKSTVLRFQIRVRESVANGATICTNVFVGQGQNPYFNTVGSSTLFCIVKGSAGFTLMSDQDTQAALQQMQILDVAQPKIQEEKNK